MIRQSIGWENGSRVPVYEPDDEEDVAPRQDQPSLVAIRRLVGFMLADPNPALGAECLALVTGIGYEGASMEAIAKRHAVTRADVSKRCVDLCDAFGVPPVRAMRSTRSRSNCRQARLDSLARQ